MNNSFFKNSTILILSGVMISLFSCWNDDTSYREAEYPEQLIYMPTAAFNNGLWVIDDINRIRGEVPYDGNPYKYIIDETNREFRVPLAVYRSGINNKGAFSIDIKINNEIIESIDTGSDDDKYILIPSDKYKMTNSVEMNDGSEIARFDLIINLDFLRENHPDKILALGIEISSSQRETNPDYGITAVIIHSKIIKSSANFSFSIDKKEVKFTNTSLMATDYQWDFGDGTTSIEMSPTHTYPTDGTFSVTLTTIGITGDEDKSTKTEVINIE